MSLPTSRDVWPPCPVAKDSLWVMADEMPLGATIPFETVEEDECHVYQTLFENHPDGKEIVVDP